MKDAAHAAALLRAAVAECSSRGLTFAAKWAAETLVDHREAAWCPAMTDHAARPASALAYETDLPPSSPASTCDRCLLARTYFDLKEFDRAAFVLQGCTDRRCRFLRLYARYMAAERRCEERLPVAGGAGADSRSDEDLGEDSNAAVATILEELVAPQEEAQLDGFERYLVGLCYRRQRLSTRARSHLIRSVHLYPYNWSAWTELAACLPTMAALEDLIPQLPTGSFMTQFFLAHARLELHAPPDVVVAATRPLQPDFPEGRFLTALRATAYYHAREFEEAESLFDWLFRQDPYRLDQADVYSNILYVMESRPKLSYLAHHCAEVDRFRPETCCVIGNYYGLRTEHEKAVVYFQRALKLNRRYLSAWTLMGHEYVELKNTAAAIDAYRRAVEMDERDHRAWSGLGQTYEFLKMPHYALYYYQKAAALRPFDTRLWSVLAGCYEVCERYDEAVQCYDRALLESENEFETLTQLARLYAKMGKDTEATEHYQLALRSYPPDEPRSDAYVETCLHLARYEKARGNYTAANQHLTAVVDHGGEDLQEARALQREIQSLIAARLKASFVSVQ
ncbi:Anaphase-promoting complex subunit 8 [Tieghemiomyces parasiticus]|uniref:Anaphase-promoting complex subunit 8 n=1 Tax=Tieghemiomyces parasiticus TaxID=78921 RepID=A0A9W8AFD3_9FUNG|nr:Anaphase-promoting complex subunit 8 [Tieghemiomyces parasiticus]